MDFDHRSVLLIQFTREPVAGYVKTRMTPHLSPSEACQLHCELTLWACRQLLDSGLGTVELCVAGDTGHTFFGQCQALGLTRLSQQRGNDLGQRMYNALCAGLRDYQYVILVGSDCPGIDKAYLVQALTALQSVPIVLGPATDGGYVLIGAREINAAIFREIPWGSDQVYAKTCAALAEQGLDWQALPALADIDRPQDLPVWDALRCTQESPPASV